jgi:hypothetical protein
MFTPWVRRKSLKRGSKSKKLVLEGESPSLIMLLSLVAIFVGVGLFVIQRSLADQMKQYNPPTPTPTVSGTPSPTPTPYEPN